MIKLGISILFLILGSASTEPPTRRTVWKSSVQPVRYESVAALARRPDGRIVAAGTVTSGGAIVTYLPDGTLDTSFGAGGVVTTQVGGIVAAILQPGGKLLTLNRLQSGYALMRFLPTGAVDETFGTDGVVFHACGAWIDQSDPRRTFRDCLPVTMAAHADGRVLVVVAARAAGRYSFVVGRYMPDGFVDRSFGTRGFSVTSFGYGFTDDFPRSIVIDSTGTAVVSGSSGHSPTGRSLAVVRYRPDGSLDASFGKGGKVVTDSGGDDSATVPVICPDGRILLGGYSYSPKNTDFLLARYLPDGHLDTTFGESGLVRTDVDEDDRVRGLHVLPDGRILVAGTSTRGGSSQLVLARYMSDGHLDASFGDKGLLRTGVEAQAEESGSATLLYPDGRLLFGGYGYGQDGSDFLVARFSPEGRRDPDFGSIGAVRTEIGLSSMDFATAVSILPDGRIVVAGESDRAGAPSMALARYMPDGSLDGAFGRGGLLAPISERYKKGSDEPLRRVHDLLVDVDGRLLLAGESGRSGPPEFGVVRLLADGQADVSFGAQGVASTRWPGYSGGTAQSLEIVGDTIVVAGNVVKFGESLIISHPAWAGFASNGAPNPAFAIGGKEACALAFRTQDEITAIARTRTGAIMLGVHSGSSGPMLARLRRDGLWDETFGEAGLAHMNGLGGRVQGFQILRDGRILAVVLSAPEGNHRGSIFLVRFRETGILDETFGAGGILDTALGAEPYSKLAVLLAPGGRFVICGTEVHRGKTAPFAARFDPDGSPDQSFGDGGVVRVDAGGPGRVVAAALDARGRYVLTGQVSLYGNADFLVLRLLPDGRPDTSFGRNGIVTRDFGGGRMQIRRQ